jgi:hypothetical protein
MNLKKVLIYSIIFMVIFQIVGLLSSEGVPCSETIPGCMGGTSHHGFPLKWYQWGSGDVVRVPDDWLKGSILWFNLLIDSVFWFIIGLLILILYTKIKKK